MTTVSEANKEVILRWNELQQNLRRKFVTSVENKMVRERKPRASTRLYRGTWVLSKSIANYGKKVIILCLFADDEIVISYICLQMKGSL